VANHLTTDLGKKVEIVSTTLDPEHDGPKQLLDWALAQGAQRKRWLFLTGSLQDVEKVTRPSRSSAMSKPPARSIT
jgi:cytochrome oxidase Cu insertion factor (SCO1/SenC/PrrC family)